MKQARLFVALPLPDQLAGTVAGLQRLLQDHAATRELRLHYPPRRNWHVTLRFIGDFPLARTRQLADGLADIFRHTAAPVTPLRGAGAFPGPRRCRIAVLHLDDPQGDLAGAHAACEHLARDLGCTPETRSYRPHITLARARHPVDLEDWTKTTRVPTGLHRFREAALYASTLTEHGPVYEQLEHWSLQPR